MAHLDPETASAAIRDLEKRVYDLEVRNRSRQGDMLPGQVWHADKDSGQYPAVLSVKASPPDNPTLHDLWANISGL